MLAEIPIELLLMIADCLSRDDVTCISLCNHRLFAVFPYQTDAVSTSREKDQLEHKLAVINRLQRDLPRYFLCYVCNHLHKHEGSDNVGLKVSSAPYKRERSLKCAGRWKKRFPLTLRIKATSPHKILYNFYFLHLQLAMRRHHYGLGFGISTEAISFTQVQLHPTWKTSTPFSVDAQICSEPASLCLRIQQMMYMKGHQPALVSSLASSRLPTTTWFCGHFLRYKLDCICSDLLLAYSEGKRAPSSDHTCRECRAEFLIGIHEHKGDLALVITKWINLGAGSTPDDPQWRVHSSGPSKDHSKVEGNARVFFEHASPRSLKVLRFRNLSYLKNERYKKVMHPSFRPENIWFIQSNIPASSKSHQLTL